MRRLSDHKQCRYSRKGFKMCVSEVDDENIYTCCDRIVTDSSGEYWMYCIDEFNLCSFLNSLACAYE